MGDSVTEADFEQLSWHDCHIWGMEFQTGDPDEDDWTSDVIPRSSGPATLRFPQLHAGRRAFIVQSRSDRIL
jgi:hypothetical protein